MKNLKVLLQGLCDAIFLVLSFCRRDACVRGHIGIFPIN